MRKPILKLYDLSEIIILETWPVNGMVSHGWPSASDLVHHLVWIWLELFPFLELSKMKYFVKDTINELWNLESCTELLSRNGQFVQYRNMPSCSNYQYLFPGTYRSNLLDAGILIPWFGFQVIINITFIQEYLASYLVYEISETNYSSVGLVGETLVISWRGTAFFLLSSCRVLPPLS